MANIWTDSARSASAIGIGLTLSWLTATNQEFSRAVQAILPHRSVLIAPNLAEASPERLPTDVLSASTADSLPITLPPVSSRDSRSKETLDSLKERLDGQLEQNPAADTLRFPHSLEDMGATVSANAPELDELENRLRELGTTYLLVERWPKGSGCIYRARCDVAGDHLPVKSSFEATGRTAVEAMAAIVSAVERFAGSPTVFSHASSTRSRSGTAVVPSHLRPGYVH